MPTEELRDIRFKRVTEGIEVARGVISESAPQIVAEIEEVPDKYWACLSQPPCLERLHLTFRYGQLFFQLSKQPFPYIPSLGKLAAQPVFDAPGLRAVYINRQSSGMEQAWHTDHETTNPPVDVLHLSDGGTFDYYKQSRRGKKEVPTEVNAGDIIRLMDPSIMHRGTNPSSKTRYVAVLFGKQTDDLL